MKISEIETPIIYLDMDGVLVDFNGKYRELFDCDPPGTAKNDPNAEQLVGTNFFDTLSKLRNADALIEFVIKHFGKYSICSSPLRGDYDNSEYWKNKWIERNLHPQPQDVIITPRKYEYARGNVLIDDREKVLRPWIEHGGIGIHYNGYVDTLDNVFEQLLAVKNN